MTSLEGWDTTNMPTLLILVRLVNWCEWWDSNPHAQRATNFKSVSATNYDTLAFVDKINALL